MTALAVSILRRMGHVCAPFAPGGLRHLLALRRRVALDELDDALLRDLGLSRDELRAALGSGREPRRGP